MSVQLKGIIKQGMVYIIGGIGIGLFFALIAIFFYISLLTYMSYGRVLIYWF